MITMAIRFLALSMMVFQLNAQTCSIPVDDPTSAPNATANPDLEETACETGINVILALDASISINGTEQVGVRAGATAVSQGLLNTFSRLAIIEFASTATLKIGYTDVDDDHIDSLEQIINGYPDNSTDQLQTNWEAALHVVNDLNENNDADLVIFLTDGNATAHIYVLSGALLPTAFQTPATPDVAVWRAIREANCLKESNARILAIGAGDRSEINEENLRLISGDDVSNLDQDGSFDLYTTDVLITEDFGKLRLALATAIGQACPVPVTLPPMSMSMSMSMSMHMTPSSKKSKGQSPSRRLVGENHMQKQEPSPYSSSMNQLEQRNVQNNNDLLVRRRK